jgi:hypothetical protein
MYYYTVACTRSAKQQPLSKQLNDQPLLGNDSVNNGSFCATLQRCFEREHSWVAYEVVSESSRTVIVVTASVKDNERGGQGHTSTSLLHQYDTRHCAVNMRVFTRVLFQLRVSFYLQRMVKSSNMSA